MRDFLMQPRVRACVDQDKIGLWVGMVTALMINEQLIRHPQGVQRALLRMPLWMYRAGLGELLNALNIMVLTTRGRKSGLPRYTPIEYRRHGSKIYVMSGWGDSPHWFQNIQASPDAAIQLGKHRYDADATIVTNPGEILRVLHLFRRTAPFMYDPMLARMSERDSITPKTLPDVSDKFTIVRFDPRADSSELMPLPIDYAWVWFGLLVAGLFTLLIVSLVRPRES